jgi:uncharacterized protein (DUF1697 family)
MEITTYVALLRGINVSGQKKMAMPQLKSVLTDFGLMNVQTYIQSGNVVFKTHNTSILSIKEGIETEIFNRFGFSVEVLLRTYDEFSRIIELMPYSEANGFLESAIYVAFIDNYENISVLPEVVDDGRYAPDIFQRIGNEVYLYCPSGYGNTKINNNYFERKFKKTATTRNLNTIRQLIDLGKY